MRAALLLVLLFSISCIAAPLSVGFALPPQNDEFYAISQRVLNGLRFWANETPDWRVGSSASSQGPSYSDFPIIVEETGSAESIGAAYLRLATKCDVLVGPVGTQALATVAAALRQAGVQKIMSVPNGDAIYYSGRVARPNASIDTNSTYPSMLSLLPPSSIFLESPTVNLTTIQRLLIKKKVYQYAVISVAPDPNSERDTFAYNMGAALAADLRKDPSTAISYSVELYGVFSNSSDLTALMTVLTNQRPQPDVVILCVPTENRTRVQMVVDAMAAAKVNPDAILWMFSLDNPDQYEPSSSRKQFKYHTWLSMWGDSLDIDGGGYLGYARTVSEHYESRYSKSVLKQSPSKRMAEWEAVGAAHGVLLELWGQSVTPAEWTAASLPASDRVFYTRRRNTFFNRVQFNSVTGRNDAFRLAAYQYALGKVKSIDTDIGLQDDISRPGRWSWKKYTLNGSAISAIVIGSILACGGVAIAIWSTYSFIHIFLNPPQEKSDEEEEDDD